jgi:glyoxylase-like metal-dependent hydrolase (beta-lactamase superfamily II)
VLDEEQLTSISNDLVRGYDLLGDQSFLLTELPGHARGQIGALVLNKLLLAVDASWGRDLLEQSAKMRLPARLANHDMNAYHETSRGLQELEAQGIELCFSHDTHDKKVLIP